MKTNRYAIKRRKTTENFPLQYNSAWKNSIRITGWLVGIVGLYVFLVYYFDWGSFCQNISEVSFVFLIGATGAYIVGLLVRASRWVLTVRFHQPLLWLQGYHTSMISKAANFVFPIRLGEVLKLIIIKNISGIDYCSSTAASIIEKLTLFLIIVLFLGLAPFVGYHFSDWSVKFFLFLCTFIFSMVIFLFFGAGVLEWIKSSIEKLFMNLGFAGDKFRSIFDNSFVKYMESTIRKCHFSSYGWRRFLGITFLSLVALLLDGLANYCLLAGFGLHLTYLQAVIASCFFNVLFLLPSPPIQVGAAEMYPILIYTGGLKLDGETVASAALVWHMLTVLVLVLLGFISFYAIGLRIGDVVEATRQRLKKGTNIT